MSAFVVSTQLGTPLAASATTFYFSESLSLTKLGFAKVTLVGVTGPTLSGGSCRPHASYLRCA